MKKVAASELLRDDARFVFLFIGSGHRLDELAAIVKNRKLDSQFCFVPYQDRAKLTFSLSVPDVHWLSLKPAMEGLIVPSKFYGIAAAARPVIAIMAPDGEIAQLVKDNGCGFVIEPGSAQELCALLRRLASDPNSLEKLGVKARAMLDAYFSRRLAFGRWDQLLAKIDGLAF